jgi:hypothetical protein
VSADLPPVRADPDFRSTVRADSFRPSPESGSYRRLVFNFYLGLLGFGLWLAAFSLLFNFFGGTSFWFLFVLFVPALLLAALLLPRVFRYHCLDCGASGRATNWAQHICPAVVQRIVTATPVQPRLPGALFQFFVELLLFGLLLTIVLATAD